MPSKCLTSTFYLFFAALGLSIFWLTSIGFADEPVPLEGSFQFDARGGELGLILRGPAAMALYNALPGEAEEDLCTGGTKKSDSNGVFCLKSGAEVTCSLGYVPTTGAVTAGPLTC